MDFKGRFTRNQLGIATLVVLALGVGTWHVLQFRYAVRNFETAIAANQLPTADDLRQAAFDEFVAALGALPSDLDRASALEAQGRALEGRASWIQRVFTTAPGADWAGAFRDDMGSLLVTLPDISIAQSEALTEAVLSTSGGGIEAKERAAMFKARRAALADAAARVDPLGEALGLDAPGVLAIVQSDELGRAVEQWIDRTAELERQALEQAQTAMSYAERASRASGQLQQDAPSREIRPVVVAWRDAASAAHSAVNILDESPSDRRIRPLVAALLEPAAEQTQSVATDIDRNLRTIQGAYETARSEEATVLGALSRFGRRATRRVKEFASSTAQQLESRSSELSVALSAGISQAAINSAVVMEQGIRAYEDSRKPPVQRYVESQEGMIAIAVGFLMLMALMSAMGFAVRGASAATARGEAKSGSAR